MSRDEQDKTVMRRIADIVPAAPKSKEKACLMVISGRFVGKMYPLMAGEISIGRGEDQDIRIDDDGVSRRHAKIVVTPAGDRQIIDVGSTNGTFHNGQKTEFHVLADGDKIQIGSTTILKFSYQDQLDETFQQQLWESATRDGLTQVYNARYFREQFKGEFSHALRQGKTMSLALFDIDHFKKINDTYGHSAGDLVLKTLGQKVAGMVRNEDLFARVGGEEFAVLLRETDEEKAFMFGMRLRRFIEKLTFEYNGTQIPVTVSVGITTLNGGTFKTHDEMYHNADAYLYAAKRAGRNRVESSMTRANPEQ